LLSLVGSVKRFVTVLVFLIGLAVGTLLLVDLLVPTPTNLPIFTKQAIRVTIIITTIYFLIARWLVPKLV